MKLFNNFLFQLFKLLIVCVIVCDKIAIAGINDLVNFLSPEGSMNSYTSPTIINNQAGGFVSGGSLIIRGPRPKTLQPVQIQTPKFNFDPCTGSADFRFGSISYVTSKEYLNFLKTLPKASLAYGAKMSLKTLCSQCEAILLDVEETIRDINNMSLEQCALSQTIAKGMFSALTNSEQQACMTRSIVAKGATDMYSSTKACKDDKNSFPGGKEKAQENLLGDKFNLVWKALNQDNKGPIDKDFFYLIMSITGTLIAEKKDDSYIFKTYPSLFDQNNVENLIGSNTYTDIKMYSCSGIECLALDVENKKLSPTETIVGKISNIIDKYLVKHVKDDVSETQLTSEESVLISYVSMPLIRLIENEIATKGAAADFLTSNSEMLEIIAYDMIVNFLASMAKLAEDKVVALKVRENETQNIDSFLTNLKSTQMRFMNFKHTAYQRAVTILQVKEIVAQQDAVFISQFNRMWKTNGSWNQ